MAWRIKLVLVSSISRLAGCALSLPSNQAENGIARMLLE
ncbi:Uncharacterized protein ChrSV_3131 [Chromobacterium vaccinii]|nr:Uncharacterized protein ChrSW_3131 [Chromobacterium vaccinii]QND90588.1 Uncharacterized protein ChrSV_3131 [Chromobacterium vaccinii]